LAVVALQGGLGTVEFVIVALHQQQRGAPFDRSV